MPPNAAKVSNGRPTRASTTASHTQMAVATTIPSAVPSRSVSCEPERETTVMPRNREYAPVVRAGNAGRLILPSPRGSRLQCVVCTTDVGLRPDGGSGNHAFVPSDGTRVSHVQPGSDQTTTNRVNHRLQAVVRAELLVHVVEMVAQGLRR